jgi:hypothetical protein
VYIYVFKVSAYLCIWCLDCTTSVKEKNNLGGMSRYLCEFDFFFFDGERVGSRGKNKKLI